MSARAGRRLQALWRWNGRPLRVRIERVERGWCIRWERWFDRPKEWVSWRSYIGTGALRDVVARYRDYADGWRGFE